LVVLNREILFVTDRGVSERQFEEIGILKSVSQTGLKCIQIWHGTRNVLKSVRLGGRVRGLRSGHLRLRR